MSSPDSISAGDATADHGHTLGAETDTSSVTAPRSVTDPPVWNRTDWKICGLLLVASLLLVGLHVRAYTTLSPIDELQHVDYLIRAGEFDIPVRNDRVGYEAMREAACRSVDSPGYAGPVCGLPGYDPNNFQERGFNTAASQFPTYYVVTGIPTRIVVATGLVGSKVTAGRMLGAIWLAGALAVTWYLMASLGVRRRSRAPVVALMLFSPFVIFHAGATVNADVSLMLTGVSVVLATVKYEAGRLRWWWLPIIYISVLFVEATNILAIAACGLYLVARRTTDNKLTLAQRLAPLAIIPGIALVRLRVAGRVQRTLFPAAPVESSADSMGSAPMFTNHNTPGVSLERVLEQVGATFTPVRNTYVSTPFQSELTIVGLELANWLLIGLLFAAAFVLMHRAPLVWWSRVVVVMLLASGPFYTFYFAYFSNQDFNAPARFALPLVPLMMVTAASAVRRRPTFAVAWTVALLVGANTLFQLVTA